MTIMRWSIFRRAMQASCEKSIGQKCLAQESGRKGARSSKLHRGRSFHGCCRAPMWVKWLLLAHASVTGSASGASNQPPGDPSMRKRQARQASPDKHDSASGTKDRSDIPAQPSRGSAAMDPPERGLYRTPYRHDGAYFLLGIGLAHLSQGNDPNEPVVAPSSFSGWGPVYDLRLGLTTYGGFSAGLGIGGMRVSGVTEYGPSTSTPASSKEE